MLDGGDRSRSRWREVLGAAAIGVLFPVATFAVESPLPTPDRPTPQVSASPSRRVEGGGGIVYGDGLGVVVSAPKGWVFDSESGVSQGLHAVIYPVGASWSNATEVMYVSISAPEDDQTLAAFIDGDVARFRENSPRLMVDAGDSINTKDGTKAEVRLFRGDPWGNDEAVAYVAKFGGVATWVLSCRSREGFVKSLPAFRRTVADSTFVQVNISSSTKRSY